jgi:hypothetical protein
VPFSVEMRAEVLVREFFGFSEVHIAHLHPGTGTPVEVPQPNMVRRIFINDMRVLKRREWAPLLTSRN